VPNYYTMQQYTRDLRQRLDELSGNPNCTIECGLIVRELERLKDETQEVPVGPGDSVWETMRKIAAMGDTVKIMCEDSSINVQTLMLAGFRGAVRLAKQALKDAGK
jgi:hypothetical protein